MPAGAAARYGEGVDITVAELKAATQKWVDAAAHGDEVVVTDKGVPVARITGIRASSLLARLEKEGLITPPAQQRAVPRLPQAEAAKDALSSLMGRLRR